VDVSHTMMHSRRTESDDLKPLPHAQHSILFHNARDRFHITTLSAKKKHHYVGDIRGDQHGSTVVLRTPAVVSVFACNGSVRTCMSAHAAQQTPLITITLRAMEVCGHGRVHAAQQTPLITREQRECVAMGECMPRDQHH
jgi:hypothetical protein